MMFTLPIQSQSKCDNNSVGKPTELSQAVTSCYLPGILSPTGLTALSFTFVAGRLLAACLPSQVFQRVCSGGDTVSNNHIQDSQLATFQETIARFDKFLDDTHKLLQNTSADLISPKLNRLVKELGIKLQLIKQEFRYLIANWPQMKSSHFYQSLKSILKKIHIATVEIQSLLPSQDVVEAETFGAEVCCHHAASRATFDKLRAEQQGPAGLSMLTAGALEEHNNSMQEEL